MTYDCENRPVAFDGTTYTPDSDSKRDRQRAIQNCQRHEEQLAKSMGCASIAEAAGKLRESRRPPKPSSVTNFYDDSLTPVNGGYRCELDDRLFLANVQVGRATDPALAAARRDAEAHVLRVLEERRQKETTNDQ